MTSALVIVADDIARADFDEFLPEMPHFQTMAAQGITFSRAYSTPVCGPSRYSIHTGEWGRRRDILHDVGSVSEGLPSGVVTLGEMAQGTAATGLFGKWHLGGWPVESCALARGYDVWRAGTFLNLNDPTRNSTNYTDWYRIDDGGGAATSMYATNRQVIALVDWWNETPGDKLAILSLNAPHGPLHRPPSYALPYGYTAPGTADARRKFHEMCLTLDVALGTLIANCALLDEALTIFLGDNGTSDNNLPAGMFPGRAKETTYERGIHIPMLLRPPGGLETPQVDDGLRHIADAWATVASQLTISASTQDSLTLYSGGHEYVISEAELADDTYKAAVIRSDGWKLVVNGVAPQQVYYLPEDPDEEDPIPHQDIPVILDELRELLENG